MNIPVVFEDDLLIAIDKPSGIVVNNATSVKGETVQNWASEYLNITDGSDEFHMRAGIVHRIDKETSGLLLIAKSPEVFLLLQAQFKERSIQKTYIAIVHGEVVPTEGEINAPIGRLPWNRERFGVVPEGKEALTAYKATNKNGFSWVEVYPHTGRTHQIRVHMKYINHPIVGDYLYAGRKTSRDDRETVGRVMLHAWKMTLMHPIGGQPLVLEAPIPDDIIRVWKHS